MPIASAPARLSIALRFCRYRHFPKNGPIANYVWFFRRGSSRKGGGEGGVSQPKLPSVGPSLFYRPRKNNVSIIQGPCLPWRFLFRRFCRKTRAKQIDIFKRCVCVCQRAPNPPEFAQPRLSRSNGVHPQREGTNLGVCLFRYGWS